MRLLVVDGHHLAYRAFHALPLLTAPDGHPTNALIGSLNVVVRALELVRPTHLLVALDSPSGSWRHREWDEYKSGRRAADSLLTWQLGSLPKVYESFGIRSIMRPGDEADDLIAGATVAAEGEGAEVRILSGDRDLWALASERTRLLVPVPGGKLRDIGPGEVLAELGVEPGRIPEWKALVGDASDNLPGVNGIGPKGAAKLLASADLDALLADPAAHGASEKQAEALRAGARNAALVRRLATLRPAPLIELEMARLDRFDRATAAEACRRWGFAKIAGSLDTLEALLRAGAA
jgi:DNA polymerase-1